MLISTSFTKLEPVFYCVLQSRYPASTSISISFCTHLKLTPPIQMPPET